MEVQTGGEAADAAADKRARDIRSDFAKFADQISTHPVPTPFAPIIVLSLSIITAGLFTFTGLFDQAAVWVFALGNRIGMENILWAGVVFIPFTLIFWHACARVEKSAGRMQDTISMQYFSLLAMSTSLDNGIQIEGEENYSILSGRSHDYRLRIMMFALMMIGISITALVIVLFITYNSAMSGRDAVNFSYIIRQGALGLVCAAITARVAVILIKINRKFYPSDKQVETGAQFQHSIGQQQRQEARGQLHISRPAY